MSYWQRSAGGRPFSRKMLEAWQASSRGRSVFDMECRELERVLPDMFGRHLLQIGSWGRGTELLSAAETLHVSILGTVWGEGIGALAEVERLPIASKSVDVVVLPHTLEFTPSPHNLLREVNRVLSDRGRIFVMGFSPFGIWGIRHRLGWRYRAFPQGARFHSAGRVCDWLELLDLEVAEVRRFSVGFPWTGARTLGEAWSLTNLIGPFAEAYLLSARKRVIPMNMVGKVERSHIRPLVGVAAPAARRNAGMQARDGEPAGQLPTR